ncbi:MAG: helix-turn-helix domain-containing protein [Rubrobacteraceae bacterium]
MSVVSRRELAVELDYGGRDAGLPVERSDATRNRLKIVDAARVLFEEHDVTSVTMEDVARAAGVGKGTLYRRFPNKGLLCQALLDEPTRRVQEEAMRLVSGDGDPLWKLGEFLALLVEFVEENLDLLYGGNEPLCGADRLARFAHPAYDWRRWTILGLLRIAERAGELEVDLDLEYIAAAILAPLDVDFYYYQRRVRGYSKERISSGIRSLVPRKT